MWLRTDPPIAWSKLLFIILAGVVAAYLYGSMGR